MHYYQVTYNIYEPHQSPQKKIFMMQNEASCDESEIKKILIQHHNGMQVTIIDRKEVTQQEYQNAEK